MIPEDSAHLAEMTQSEGWRVYCVMAELHRERLQKALAKHSVPIEETEYLRGQIEGLDLVPHRIREALGGSDARR